MLKSEINDPVWFFDLEWVPDGAGAIRLYDLPQGTSEREAMQKLWENAKGYDPVECPRPFVKYALSRVVSIAFLSRRITYVDGVRKVEFGLHSLPKMPLGDEVPTESYILSQFLHYVGIREPQIVGFNSLESDLQVIIQRSLINEVRAEAFCKRADAPWRGRDYFDSRNSEWHLDLIQRFSRSNGMTPRLNELARLSGFPGKIDTNGDQVVDLWLDGRYREIVEYNQIDTLNTYLLWLRVANFSCKIREDHYVEEQDDFREFLEAEAEKPTGGHIRNFLDAWDSIV
jgi:3'-5' exonuclease